MTVKYLLHLSEEIIFNWAFFPVIRHDFICLTYGKVICHQILLQVLGNDENSHEVNHSRLLVASAIFAAPVANAEISSSGIFSRPFFPLLPNTEVLLRIRFS